MKIEAKFARFRQNIALTRQLTDNDMLMIADLTRFDVLVTPGKLLYRVRMKPAFVRECRRSDKGCSDIVLAIRQFVDE